MPFIVSINGNTNPIQGQTAYLTCHYRSVLEANVTWLQLTSGSSKAVPVPISKYFNATTLQLVNVTTMDSSTYVCQVENPSGQVNKSVAVNVTCKSKTYF